MKWIGALTEGSYLFGTISMSIYQIDGGKQVQRHESLGGVGVIYPACNPKMSSFYFYFSFLTRTSGIFRL